MAMVAETLTCHHFGQFFIRLYMMM